MLMNSAVEAVNIDSLPKDKGPFENAWSITHPDLLWVCRAASTDDFRYFMNGIRVEKKKGEGFIYICTDGKALHVFQTKVQLLEPGDYKIIKSTKKEIVVSQPHDVHFPTWRRVIPKYTKPSKLQVMSHGSNRIKRRRMTDVSRLLCDIGYASNGNIALQVSLVDRIFDHPTIDLWHVYFKVGASPDRSGSQPGSYQGVIFHSFYKSHMAVLMPIQYDWS